MYAERGRLGASGGFLLRGRFAGDFLYNTAMVFNFTILASCMPWECYSIASRRDGAITVCPLASGVSFQQRKNCTSGPCLHGG